MDYAALFTAGVAGMAIGGLVPHILLRKAIRAQRKLGTAWQMKVAEYAIEHDALAYTLQALRSNCFITNERGHRVRYTKATPEQRRRAEGGAA